MKACDPQRRIMLRGTLAAGISLALFGCNKSPQTSMTNQPSMGETSSSSQPVAAAPSTPVPGAKVSKKLAHYQEQPKGDQKCATCANFIPESRNCRIVEGPISPEGWCVYWAAKA